MIYLLAGVWILGAWMRLILYLLLVCVTVCEVLLGDEIPGSHRMYNANPKLCYTFVRIPAFCLTRRRWHWNALFGCI